MVQQITIQKRVGRQWLDAAVVRPANIEVGHLGTSVLEYLPEYALANVSKPDTAAIACSLPANFDYYEFAHWPAFLLDLLPSGAGRDRWIRELQLNDGAQADWPLLQHACANPPGDLRVKESFEFRQTLIENPLPTAQGELVCLAQHPGFSTDEVATKQEHFVEYAYQHGAFTAGASDIQGVAPKLLMNQDKHGQWHAEGVLAEQDITRCCLVKLPRNVSQADKKVLRNEAAYMKVAASIGLRVATETQAGLFWQNDVLFIPRFDRHLDEQGRLQFLGMESLASLAGVAQYASEYGGNPNHNELVEALANFSHQANEDVLEYLKRDVINIVMGNKDNHARNSAVLKYPNGQVMLAPLFDFAPMYLDPEVIPRACRWQAGQEQAGQPIWAQVIANLPQNIDQDWIKQQMKDWYPLLSKLPEWMAQHGVDEDIITHRQPSAKAQIEWLQEGLN